jgi:hypothetical protein
MRASAPSPEAVSFSVPIAALATSIAIIHTSAQAAAVCTVLLVVAEQVIYAVVGINKRDRAYEE